MNYLAQVFKRFFEEYVTKSRQRDPDVSIRPILIGPPREVLKSLFDLLTASGSTEWQLSMGGSILNIPVLLVRDEQYASTISTPSSRFPLSRDCIWYYAVSVRNSSPVVLMLVERSAWDNRPESLANTTETIGSLKTVRGGQWLRNLPWNYIVDQVSASTGLNSSLIKGAFQRVARESQALEPSVRDRGIWHTANSLLSPSPSQLGPEDFLAFFTGLPAIGLSRKSIGDAESAIKSFGNLVREHGFAEAFDKLAATPTANSRNLQGELRSLFDHITRKALSSTNFSMATSWYYEPEQPVPAWWTALDTATLEQLLDETGERPLDRLKLECENALNMSDQCPNEPSIVSRAVNLHATASRHLSATTFRRILSRASPVILSSVSNDPSSCVDSDAVPHEKPIRYSVDAPNFRSGAATVLILDSFICKGIAHVRGADRNPPPVKTKGQDRCKQEIALPRGGAIDLGIYYSQDTAFVYVRGASLPQPLREEPNQGRSPLVTIVLDVEDNDVFSIVLEDRLGNKIGEWDVQFTISATADIAPSRFSALVSAHQRSSQRSARVALPRPPDTLAQRLESEYLISPDSWKPVLACWSANVSTPLNIDWSHPVIGNAYPQVDPRPNIALPNAVFVAREGIRDYLRKKQRAIAEIELDEAEFLPYIEQYLRAYLDWLKESPGLAVWMDSIAVHAALPNQQAGGYTATSEPIAILLSPLHPIKLGWHGLAQQQLSGSLKLVCPAAGLLDPSSCPDTTSINMFQLGQTPISRTFFAVACNNPHWSILWNRKFLGNQEERLSVLARLSELGLESRGISGGFSRSQTIDSIEEVSKLLSGRATMRLGIIGTPENSSILSEGVIEWCEQTYDEDNDSALVPFSMEVYDMRGGKQPSPEKLAILSERTQEMVRWFKVANVPPTSPLDLVILDQLGAGSPDGCKEESRSPLGMGALYRVRIREDYQNAVWLRESRIGRLGDSSDGLAGLVQEVSVALEELSDRDAQISHFQFQPNQQAIGSRLRQSTYLAVTSSQIDPGGIIRGAKGQQGYLWDYELPGVLGGDEDSAGYYLLAEPLRSMIEAIKKSIELVTHSIPTDQNTRDLIDEISRRGIPILKRLASGGTQSRGELGLLLALRLIQDVFRVGTLPPRLPVWEEQCIHIVLPVDPFEEPFEKIRVPLCGATTNARRPDLLVVAIRLSSDNSPTQLKFTPVEVKFRGDGDMTSVQLADALDQARNLGKMLDAAWVQQAPTLLWDTCSLALLAECLDFTFRIYADENLHRHTPAEWARKHEKVLADVLGKRAIISVNKAGRLIVFDQSTATTILDMDGDGRRDTAVICPVDAACLLSGMGTPTLEAQAAIGLLDFSFPDCQEKIRSATNNPPMSERPAAEAIESPQPGEATPIILAEPQIELSEDTSERQSIQDTDSSQFSRARQATTAIPPEIRLRVHGAFEGFIGNEPAVRRIKNDLLRALIEMPPHLSKNYLFTGEPSTGKTELARRVATVLALPFVRLDGRGVSSRERLFELINGELGQQGVAPSEVGRQSGLPLMEYPPLIVFIDEVHLVARSMQESLLTVLETVDRTVILASQVAKMNRTTFLFATTRASDVDRAFRSRCAEVQLREYTAEEVAEMVKRRFPLGWPNETCLEIARLGRRVPRIAMELAKELETEVTVSENTEYDLETHLHEVRKAREIDERGLTPDDRAYLQIIEHEGRPMGEQAILNMLGTVDRDRVLDEIEPFLRRLGFLRLGARGREITPEGRAYLLGNRRNS